MNLKYSCKSSSRRTARLGSARPQLKRGRGLTRTRATGGCSATDPANPRKGQLISSQSTRPHEAAWTCWCSLLQGHLLYGHLQTLHIHSKCSSYSTSHSVSPDCYSRHGPMGYLNRKNNFFNYTNLSRGTFYF